MEPLVANDPENLEYLGSVGRSFRMNGIRMFLRGQSLAAQDSLAKAVATLERVRHAAPEDVEALRWLAVVHADLGLVGQQTGELANRVRSLRRALAIFEALGKLIR